MTTNPSTTAVAWKTWAAVGPLHALQLGPLARRKAIARCRRAASCAPEACSGVATRAPPSPCSWSALRSPSASASRSISGSLERLGIALDVDLAVAARHVARGRLARRSVARRSTRRRHAAGPAHERGVELVDVARGVLERAGHVRAHRLAVGRPARSVGSRAPTTALLCTFAVTSHCGAPALARLPVARVPATPAAVLAQRDAIWVVAFALIGLVVTALALLAREGDSDPDVSAGHVRYPCVVVNAVEGEEKPRPGEVLAV